ncbi:MAG: hypothetical protein LBT83_05670 [Tannerella sp.]|nr:hypothetical protein [Tannerella sp.]
MISLEKKGTIKNCLSKIVSMEVGDIDKWGSVFGFFVSSNPDTLYNISYYTNKIEEFKGVIKFFKEIYEVYKTVSEELYKQHKGDFTTLKIELIFDELFHYTFESSVKFDFYQRGIEKFRIDTIKKNPHLFRIVIKHNESNIQDFLYSIKFDETEKFKEKIVSHLEKTLLIIKPSIDK